MPSGLGFEEEADITNTEGGVLTALAAINRTPALPTKQFLVAESIYIYTNGVNVGLKFIHTCNLEEPEAEQSTSWN